MNKMGHLTHNLANTLGEDTTKLGFRVGVHSGPVVSYLARVQMQLTVQPRKAAAD